MPDMYVPPYCDFRIMYFNGAFRCEDACCPGFYYAAGPRISDRSLHRFKGSVLFESRDNTIFEGVNTVPNHGVMGLTRSKLGPVGSCYTHFWDDANKVTVELFNAWQSLESKSDIEVLNGANRAMLGREVIAFANATYLGDNQYELSRLLRGLHDTDEFTNNHQTVTGLEGLEPFTLMNEDTVVFQKVQPSDIGTQRYYKAVPAGADVDDAEDDPQAFTIEAVNMQNPKVCHVEYSWDGSNNLNITWLPRSRVPMRLTDANDIGLCCCGCDEEYQIDLIAEPGPGVFQTVSTVLRNHQFTAGVLNAAGYMALPGAITFDIYHMSCAYGRGQQKRIITS